MPAVRLLLLGLMLAVATQTKGCPPTDIEPDISMPSGTHSPKEAEWIRDSHGGLNCELKNGPTGCVDDQKRTAQTEDLKRARELELEREKARTNAEIQSARDSGFQPWECQQGPTAMLPAWKAMLTGRVSAWQDYCDQLERQRADEILASSPSSSGDGGGCVWKGRPYKPGDSIRSATDGQIYSYDLKVNGQDFGSLSGRVGPLQGCDCGSRSGTWQCI
jgi:hypothetical protein